MSPASRNSTFLLAVPYLAASRNTTIYWRGQSEIFLVPSVQSNRHRQAADFFPPPALIPAATASSSMMAFIPATAPHPLRATVSSSAPALPRPPYRHDLVPYAAGPSSSSTPPAPPHPPCCCNLILQAAGPSSSCAAMTSSSAPPTPCLPVTPQPHPPMPPALLHPGKLILVKCTTIYLFECVILFINAVEFVI
jgi:hypothetical protein